MGSATVVSGGPDGKYRVELDLGESSRAYLVSRLSDEIVDVEAKIAEKQTALTEAEAKTAAARLDVDVAIAELADYQAHVSSTADLKTSNAELVRLSQKVDQLLRKVIELEGAASIVRAERDELKGNRDELVRERARYNSLVLTRTVDAWCADLTEDATGEVATMEIPGEPQAVLIAPGAPPNEVVLVGTPKGPVQMHQHGLLLNRGLMTPEQAFFNYAVLPGWQKWMPTYRKGTVTGVDYAANTVDVQLDEAKSSAQDLRINQADLLENVTVDYMNCHCDAFEVGDRCVVYFPNQRWDNKVKVIGFVERPKPCSKYFAFAGETWVWYPPDGTVIWYSPGVGNEVRYFDSLWLTTSDPNTDWKWGSDCVVEARADGGEWVVLTYDSISGGHRWQNGEVSTIYRPEFRIDALARRYISVGPGQVVSVDNAVRVYIRGFDSEAPKGTDPSFPIGELIEYRAKKDGKQFFKAAFRVPAGFHTDGGTIRTTLRNSVADPDFGHYYPGPLSFVGAGPGEI